MHFIKMFALMAFVFFSSVFSQSLPLDTLGCLSEDLVKVLELYNSGQVQDSLFPTGSGGMEYKVIGDCDQASITVGGVIELFTLTRQNECEVLIETAPMGTQQQEPQVLNTCDSTITPSRVLSGQQKIITRFRARGGRVTFYSDHSLMELGELKIFNSMGILVAGENNLSSVSQSAFYWDGDGVYTVQVPPGIYFLKIEAAYQTKLIKFIFHK